LLFQVLEHNFARRAKLGCDQFVYYRATDPRKCLAPDGFVRLGGPDESFDSWKTWERGAPELCVEIVSESDARTWDDKLAAYAELGVSELVRFDADAPAGSRIRIWDRLEGDLVEREVELDRSPCRVLGGAWVVTGFEVYPAALRLEGEDGALLPTSTEAEALARDADRAAAERRIAELEAELRRRDAPKT
ncbi:MAG TPA: Uma2 family endonuclease, partial [Byssovorax sp.]